MSALHLEIHLRVPVAVVQDDDVGGVQVDAQAAGARGQQENELLAALGVVVVDLRLTVLAGGVTCTEMITCMSAAVGPVPHVR